MQAHTKDTHDARLAMRRLMQRRGIALDDVEIEPRRVLPVEIWQNEACLSSVLFKAGAVVECCVWVKIVSHISEPIVIKDVSLKLPFVQEQFAWLDDPLRVSKQQIYCLPFSRDFFARAEVINHKLRQKLLPGVPIEGFLLGTMSQPLPKKLKGEIIGKLRIRDRIGREVCKRVSLYIDTRVFRSLEAKRLQEPATR